MIKIGFIGVFDKTDLIVQVAKILQISGKRVLVIDSTINQKAKYIIPVINPTTSYITEFEEFDVAVGFENFNEMNDYLGIDDLEVNYDIALIDVDSSTTLEKFNLFEAKNNFFITSFDMFSLKKGLEILSGLKQEMNLYKVLFSRYIDNSDNDYLNFISRIYKIRWEEDIVYFPFEIGDQSAIIENQRVSKVKLKNLSDQYKEGIAYIVSKILGEANLSDAKKIIKMLEKGA